MKWFLMILAVAAVSAVLLYQYRAYAWRARGGDRAAAGRARTARVGHPLHKALRPLPVAQGARPHGRR